MTRTFRTKAIAIGMGVLLALSLSGVAQAIDAYPPGVTPVKCLVKKVNGAGKIKVNVNPNQPGNRYYTFKVDVKKRGEWYRYLKPYQTVGTSETKVIALPKGTYRIHCFGKYGFTTANSATFTLKGGKAVSCHVAAVNGGSKIKVNMGPNLSGSKYYTFKIDVRKNGAWFRYAQKYNTQGTAETRTINLPAGKYRAHCFGKYTYGWANSTAVVLTK